MKSLKLNTLLLALLMLSLPTVASSQELVIFSSRKEHLIKPIIEDYQKETGVKVKLFTGKDGALIQRLKSEGKRSKGDILMTVDGGNLWYAAKQGLFTPLKSEKLNKSIPENYRSTNSDWFGFSLRARTIVYNTDRIKATDLKSYADLAGAKWKDKLVLRTSKKVYNQSLVAMLIKLHGQDKAKEIVKGWVNNLGAPVTSSDTDAIKMLAAGKGQIAVVNTYYLAKYLKENSKAPLGLFWPKVQDGGTHINVSGAGVLKSSKNKKEAQKFLEWLASPKAQKKFAELNFEFPAVKGVEVHPIVKKWGTFEPANFKLEQAGELQRKAIELMDSVGYN
jgi:iron(III) transport system substrate-binding protein